VRSPQSQKLTAFSLAVTIFLAAAFLLAAPDGAYAWPVVVQNPHSSQFNGDPPPGEPAPSPDDDELWEDQLYFLLLTIHKQLELFILDGSLDPEGTPEDWMLQVQYEFYTFGFDPGLTPAEKEELLDTIDRTEAHLSQAPQSVDPAVIAGFLDTLGDMRVELGAP
jgi:hypothetical protein